MEKKTNWLQDGGGLGLCCGVRVHVQLLEITSSKCDSIGSLRGRDAAAMRMKFCMHSQSQSQIWRHAGVGWVCPYMRPAPTFTLHAAHQHHHTRHMSVNRRQPKRSFALTTER
jgi:hypothetical protein